MLKIPCGSSPTASTKYKRELSILNNLSAICDVVITKFWETLDYLIEKQCYQICYPLRRCEEKEKCICNPKSSAILSFLYIRVEKEKEKTPKKTIRAIALLKESFLYHSYEWSFEPSL